MPNRARRSRWLSFLPLAALLACGDDGTGPEDRLQLTPGQAAPFTLVDVAGLPDEYATARMDITVGGQSSVMIYDADAGVHRFMVPDLAPGRAEIVFPTGQGGRELRASLEVTARQYAGGSPTASIEQMNTLLDSLQVSVSYGLAIVDADADSAIYDHMNGFLAAAEALQDQVATLSPADRATVAALFSGMAPDLAIVTARMTAGLEDLRSQPPILGSMAAATTPLSASAVVATCVDHQATLKMLERAAQVMGYVSIMANRLAWFGGPAVKATVAMFAYAFTFTGDLVIIIANSVPKLLDAEGLRLQTSPARLRHNGGEGVMTAWVHRRAAGALLGTAIGSAMGLSDVIKAVRRFDDARKAIDWKILGPVVGGAIGDLGVMALLDQVSTYTSDLLAEQILPEHEVQITMEGLTLTSGAPSSRWEFTGAAGALGRGIRTVGQNQQPVETFSLAARMGSAPGCTAVTESSNPSLGLNGFEIATAARVRYLVPAQGVSVSVPAGSGTSGSLAIANQGTEASGALTYRLQYANGLPYSPRTWLTVSAPSGPSRLAAGAQGSVRVSISAAGNALQQQLVVPVAVLEDGKVVDNAWVQVNVQPQLSDITVNRSPSTVRLWDHGTQDGDIITVTLNGAPVASALSLTNAGTSLPVEYRPGRNVLIVRAHNEGSLRPNTASLGFANVVRGQSTQSYDLSTGQITQLVITYDPNATAQSSAASQRLPEPVYTRCSAVRTGDCRP